MDSVERYIVTFFFIVGVGLFSVFSFLNTKESICELTADMSVESVDDMDANISKIDDAIIEGVVGRYKLVEAYGQIAKLLGKHEVNGFEYVIDKNGFLSLGNFWNDVYDIDEKELAYNTEQFYEMLQKKDIPALFVAYPQKVSDRWTKGYAGIPYDDFSYEMKMFMIQIRKYRIPSIDLTSSLETSGLTYEEMFFKTDHHWTSAAAFVGFQAMLDKIKTMGIDLDSDGYYTNLDNYTIEHYDKMMLGSEGRSTGINYVDGLEDFDLYYLDDGSNYTMEVRDKVYTGNIKESVINYDIPHNILRNSDSVYNLSMYDMYCNGINAHTRIKNESNSEGPNILLLTDSYSTPIATWLAPVAKSIDMLWMKKVSDQDVRYYIDNNSYDLIIMALYPNDMTKEFIHFPTEEE